ncbi:MAG: ARC6/PARC6 family protein, partial [Leptolyngbyaceae bacterium]|nr:ARC6/PARC6 family protein [Leptolyngbyaceae bacterium]
ARTYDTESGQLTDSALMGSGRGISAEGGTGANIDPFTPSLEIPEDHLIGALLILLELGEYELVLKLGKSYLNSSGIRLKTTSSGQLEPVLADIVLTLALASLELGREQWQQCQYENAAESLRMGMDLLLREGVFLSVRSEIQLDLYKLRPYRILELLALDEKIPERRLGIQLLREMLQERGGIDGHGNDQSGLSIDDFLRFIQQLRGYLTVIEQQTLFEEEARRPSAVATYLAVYALLARGFAQRQPALIRRAKLMLMRLGSRQDVYLEQAVCALFLGQTEEASRALDLSRELEQLTFIREHSQGAPDLLPGLCLYSERWLQEEVFPHFRDLSRQRVALKDYFADEQVQSYLEELPNAPESSQELASHPSQLVHGQVPERSISPEAIGREGSLRSPYDDIPVGSPAVTNLDGTGLTPVAGRAPLTTVNPILNEYDVEAGLQDSGWERELAGEGLRSLPPDLNGRGKTSASVPASDEIRSDRPGRTPSDRPRKQSPNPYRDPEGEATPTRRAGNSPKPSLKISRLLLLIGVGLLGLGGLGFLATLTYGWVASKFQASPTSPELVLQPDQPMVQLNQPPIVIPQPNQVPVASPTPSASPQPASLTQEVAQQVVQSWLTAKSSALGATYSTDGLNQILVDPILSQWQKRAEEAKKEGWYWEYKHSTPTINAVEVSETNPNQAKVEAEVGETASFFQQGQLSTTDSYDAVLRVQYGLVRQNDQWQIQTISLLP